MIILNKNNILCKYNNNYKIDNKKIYIYLNIMIEILYSNKKRKNYLNIELLMKDVNLNDIIELYCGNNQITNLNNLPDS